MKYRIGIDLGGTKTEGILMTETGEIVRSARFETPSDYVGTIAMIRKLVLEMDACADQVCPVGLATPGAWMEDHAAMKNCNSTCLNGRPLLHDVRKVLARPIRIANDADCFVYSEATDGAATGENCVFGVILGTGVGGGWVVNGQLINGPNALAGEWGHNVLPWLRNDELTMATESNLNDRECYCGRINCVETFLSGPGLQRTHFDLHNENLSANEIASSSRGQETLSLYISMLGRALSQIVNVVDPHIIVLGGGVSNIDRLYEELPTVIQLYAFRSENKMRIVKAKHGDASGKRGAAWLFPA